MGEGNKVVMTTQSDLSHSQKENKLILKLVVQFFLNHHLLYNIFETIGGI